ncbi:MAG: enolase N-terminal-like fold-containing protein, partial [Fidelibacterota bacterium]
MEILDRLIAPIPKQPVEEVIVGVHSVLVKTADNCGIASTIKY